MQNQLSDVKTDLSPDLFAQQSLLQLIFEAEPECVKVLSEEGRLLTMNPAGLAIIEAQSLEEVRGKMILDLIVPEHREAFVRMHREVTSGQSRHLEFEIVGLHGRRRWLETRAVPLRNPDGSISHLALTRDITERRQSEALWSGLYRVLELIASGVALPETLAELLRVVEAQSAGLIGSILLLDLDGVHLTHGAAPNLPAEYCCAIDGVAIGPKVGSCGTAAFRREQVIVENIATDPLWADYRDLALKHGLQSCWSSPIFDKNRQVLGTYAMYYRRPARPTAREFQLIELATQTAAIAINKHRQENALRLAEAASRKSEAMLGLVLDSIPQGVFWKDRQSVYLGANRVSRQAMGLTSPQSVVGLTDFDVPTFSHEQAEFFAAKDREVMDSDRPQYGIVETMTQADGSNLWLETNKLPMHDSAGNVIGIMGTWENITERKRADEDLKASRERLSVLSGQLIAAQETERRQVARELHDEIGQALTGIKLNLKALQQSDATDKQDHLVADTLAVVNQTLQQVRNLALDLRPSMLDDIGLVAAVRWCLDRQAQRAGYTAHFHSEPSEISVPPEIAIACYRVAQEALTNIARHAHASQVLVKLELSANELLLIVQNDGAGFDVTTARERAVRGGSLGLLGMQERVELVSGQLEIQSSSAGTTIRACFPVIE